MNAHSPDHLRLFFALWPDDTTRASLMQLQATLHGRLIPYSNLHLTLAFLGQQPAGVVDACKDILLRLDRQAAMLTLDRVGYFSRNRVIWAGMHQVPEEVLGLHRDISQALTRHGIADKAEQAFKPHVTLARDAAAPGDISFAPIPWRAAQVALLQSKTLPDGSVYEVLATRSLDDRVWIPDENSGTGSLRD